MPDETTSSQADDRKRRVLVVEPSGNLWGSERALLDLCSGLASTHWEVGICCPPNTPMLSHCTPETGTIYPVYTANLHLRSKFARLLAVFRLLKVVRLFRPDLIYVNQAGATKVALMAARFAGLPVVSHIRLLKDVEYVRPLAASSRLNHLICISRFIEDAFSPQSVKKVQLHTIFDGYQSVRNTPVKSATQNVAACPGRIAHIKGQDILLQAARKVSATRPDLKFRVIGGAAENDPFDQQLRKLHSSLQLDDTVSLEPFADNIWPCLESSDFLVCPSRVEPLGRVVFEAWDAGIVPIAHRGSGGPAETISAADGGILYEDQDPDCLARTILAAYELSAAERREMVERGRSWTREQLEPSTYAHRIAHVFDTALNDC